MKEYSYDFIIIGSGIAGLTAAEYLSEEAKTGVITKNTIIETATKLAQGGIAAALNKDDAPKYHLQDTIKAGAGLCDKKAVNVLVSDGVEQVKELIKWGAHFDKIKGQYDFSKEGAHSKRRILHAKDATGQEIENTLKNDLIKKKKTKFHTNTDVIKLLVKNNRCYGCVAVKNKELRVFYAKAIIMATGGCGQVYKRNTNPTVATGDGIALAFEAGADIQDMEFIQFHPTTLYVGDKKPISIFLISETVRGEGAILKNIAGKRFMPDYHPLAELAPRDIVSRAIFQEMKKQSSQHVFLDLSNIKHDLKERFPTIYERCMEAKIDITRDFIPVTPGAHYSMGGIKTGADGKTSIQGLFAAGEVSSLGLHGANRLASNSLLDGLVFGHRAAMAAVKYASKVKGIDAYAYFPAEIRPLTKKKRSEILSIKQTIRNTMWQKVGIERVESDLKQALLIFKSFNWLKKIETLEVELLEVKNMLIVAELITEFALNRKESRGAHYRIDYPDRDDINWQKHQVFNKKTI
ncbi:L-aspartate oxidase [Candidatus Margulisiibacteriota bacterium]